MYTAIVLDETSRVSLLEAFVDEIPKGWETVAHHMTINMGPSKEGPAAGQLGRHTFFEATAWAKNDRVIAAKVESDVPSVNDVKHVTIAVNRKAGGKPVDSNRLTDWFTMMASIPLHGTIEEVG